MKAQQLKLKIISEDHNDQIERLVKQLDHVKHIAESEFWISTDELGILLNLDNSFIDALIREVKFHAQDCHFLWRNFECILVDRQFDRGFWAIRKRQNLLSSTSNNSSKQPAYISTIQDSKPLTKS